MLKRISSIKKGWFGAIIIALIASIYASFSVKNIYRPGDLLQYSLELWFIGVLAVLILEIDCYHKKAGGKAVDMVSASVFCLIGGQIFGFMTIKNANFLGIFKDPKTINITSAIILSLVYFAVILFICSVFRLEVTIYPLKHVEDDVAPIIYRLKAAIPTILFQIIAIFVVSKIFEYSNKEIGYNDVISYYIALIVFFAITMAFRIGFLKVQFKVELNVYDFLSEFVHSALWCGFYTATTCKNDSNIFMSFKSTVDTSNEPFAKFLLLLLVVDFFSSIFGWKISLQSRNIK